MGSVTSSHASINMDDLQTSRDNLKKLIQDLSGNLDAFDGEQLSIL